MHHTSRDVYVMFACIACGSLEDAEMYRFAHGNAAIWNFFWSVQRLTRELKFHISKKYKIITGCLEGFSK